MIFAYNLAMALKIRWMNCCTDIGAASDISETYWSIIETRYSEQQRYYHRMSHIISMFNHFDTVSDQLVQPLLVSMVIFFHDIIYDPTRKDNEEKSADLFRIFYDSVHASNAADRETGAQWILATKSHKTDVQIIPGLYGTEDWHFFLDMDMAILGSPLAEYEEYSTNIRREYIHFPEEVYRKRRSRVLQDFLLMPNIFATQHFRCKYEVQARKNIQAEIERLEDNSIGLT